MDMTDVLLAMGEARRAKRHITISLKQGGPNPRVMTQLGAPAVPLGHQGRL